MLLILFLLILLLILYKFRHYKILFNSFKYKRIKKIDDSFGCYFICGKQGSFKTFYSCILADRQNRHIVNKIKTNIKSLNIPDFKIEYFTKIDEIYYDVDEYVIYIIDEVSRKYNKNSKTDMQFYAWLNQCRKRHRMCIMITQEWRELPLWLRRPAKFMISSKPLLFWRVACIGDAENMVFDKDEGDYICPPIVYQIYKPCQYYAQMYDTFEPINEL